MFSVVCLRKGILVVRANKNGSMNIKPYACEEEGLLREIGERKCLRDLEFKRVSGNGIHSI